MADILPDLDTVDDYATGKEWEFAAAVSAMLSVKDDLEPLPLFSPNGQQVGIGVGLYWWTDQDGALQWAFHDMSHSCHTEEEVGAGNRDDGYWDEVEGRYWPIRAIYEWDGLASETPY